jgi:hypothetical protein
MPSLKTDLRKAGAESMGEEAVVDGNLVSAASLMTFRRSIAK